MVTSDAASAEDYLNSLEPDRRELVATVRDLVLANLPEGYVEAMRWGMISYEVPLERYPETYNSQPLGYAALASQKRHVSLYLHGVYSDPALAASFTERWRATGKRLDMGKSCVRVTRLDQVPLDLVAETIAAMPVEDFIARYEAARV